MQTLNLSRLAAAFILAFGVSQGASALVIATDASGTFDPDGANETFSDPQSAGAGSVSSSGSTSGGSASASQTAGGVSTARAGDDFGAAYGSGGNSSFSASASWMDTVNTAAGSYRYDFSLGQIRLQISDFAGVSDADSQHMHARYTIEVLLDGAPIFSSNAELSGGRVLHVLNEGGTDLGGTFYGGGTGVFGYTFAPSAFSLNLGSYGAGDSFDLQARILAEADYPGFETGALAEIGDPGSIRLPIGLSGQIVFVPGGQAPIPGTALLLGLGLAGLAWRRRSAA